jgi:hypothetical protein
MRFPPTLSDKKSPYFLGMGKGIVLIHIFYLGDIRIIRREGISLIFEQSFLLLICPVGKYVIILGCKLKFSRFPVKNI